MVAKFHFSLPQYLSSTMEKIQKRALRIIFGYEVQYEDALKLSGITILHKRTTDLCR